MEYGLEGAFLKLGRLARDVMSIRIVEVEAGVGEESGIRCACGNGIERKSEFEDNYEPGVDRIWWLMRKENSKQYWTLLL